MSFSLYRFLLINNLKNQYFKLLIIYAKNASVFYLLLVVSFPISVLKR